MPRGRHLKLLLTGVGVTLLALGLSPAGASSANISHSYRSTNSVTSGGIVSLDSRQTGYVEPANTSNGAQLLGVAVAGNDSLIAVDATPGTVQVATSGTATTLVSTLNGDINVGDQIGVSPFNGVGMKALPGSHTIGLAQTAFNSATQGATSRQVTNKDGTPAQVSIGYIRLNIAIGLANTTGGQADLNSLQKIAKSLTGHTVSTTRVLLSLVIAIVSMTALITLIYASIYGSIISIGRNPLAKYAVFRTLGSVVGMAVLTALTAGATIFLLLR